MKMKIKCKKAVLFLGFYGFALGLSEPFARVVTFIITVS